MKKKKLSGKTSARRGSAFVVVIGMLAVMILMGIAFSTFIQTEQAGSTSLKNGLVARQSLQSALGRVIEAIDLSFGGVSNEWPVCVWPEPWLSSCPHQDLDYYQSARCDARPDARIITKEIADMLTPSQLAMARSAQVGWAPVFGGIASTREMAWERGSRYDDRVIGRGQYRNGGLDASDSVVGRYAFIAIETTGLLDMNQTDGATTATNSTWHGDPAEFVLPEFKTGTGSGDDDRAFDSAGNPIPSLLADRSKFLQSRPVQGYSSFAAAVAKEPDAFNLDPNKPDKEDEAGKTYLPADLFAGFAPSLEELSPDGLPRVPLRPKKWDSTTVRPWAARVHRAMARVFADSWCDEKATTGEEPVMGGYTVFARDDESRYELSRARLATVAAIDAMDEDAIPGGWNTGSQGELWKAASNGGLPDLDEFDHESVAANGKRVSVTVPADTLALPFSGTTDFLNYPRTEPAPLLNRVWARIVPEGKPDFDGPANSNATMIVSASLSAGAVAGFQNEVPAGDEHATSGSYSLEVEWEVMLSTPAANSVAKDGKNGDIYAFVCGKPKKGDADKTPHREWWFGKGKFKDSMKDAYDDGADSIVLQPFGVGGTSGRNQAKPLSDEADAGKGILEASCEGPGDVPIEIVCHAWCWRERNPKTNKMAWYWRNEGFKSAPPDGAIQGEDSYQNVYFYPVTQDEEDDEDDNYDLETGLPIRMKVTIKNGNNVVQQVPAPQLDQEKHGHAWWIRVDPVVYHPKGSGYAGDKGQAKAWWERNFAPGWAMCLDPVFAFDTSSLYTTKANPGVKDDTSTYAFPPKVGGKEVFHGFWINDAIARNFAGFSGTARDNQLKDAMGRLAAELDHPDAEDDWLIGSAGSAASSTHWNYVQREWLWDTASDFAPVSRWLNRALGCMPDNLHAWKQNGSFGGLSGGAGASCYHENGGPFLVRGGNSGKPVSTRTIAGLKSHVRNKPFESVGDLGRVRIGPYETLSLFRAYRFGTRQTDVHRVFDWFTVGTDRTPEAPKRVENDGTVSYVEEDLFSGLHAGLANLNAPAVLRWRWRGDGNDPTRVERAKQGGNVVGNPYPVAAAMAGAGFLDHGYHKSSDVAGLKTVPMDLALEFASALGEFGGVKVTNKFGFWTWLPDWPSYGQTNSVTINDRINGRIKTRVSDVGAAEDGGVNPLLETVSEYLEDTVPDKVARALTDEDREALLANTSEALTVRGQTFLVILRADAYTPRYGEETAEDGEGTTLATTHALIELFRDPNFARRVDGDRSGPPEDGDGRPVFYHNWYIKSMRIL